MLFQIIIWTILIGLIGVGGAYFLARPLLKSTGRLLLVVSFAAGALVGVSFLELLPEALAEEGASAEGVLLAALLGFVFFYLLGRFLVFHHCHDEHCQARTTVPLIIVGDSLHNFLDGLAVAASFLVNAPTGLATSLAIIFHEIPQEVGDLGILLHSGYSKIKALTINIFSALLCVLGGAIGFYFFDIFKNFLPYILALTAGGFLYIGASDLLPQTHRLEKRPAIFSHTLMFLLGVIILWLLGLVIGE